MGHMICHIIWYICGPHVWVCEHCNLHVWGVKHMILNNGDQKSAGTYLMKSI